MNAIFETLQSFFFGILLHLDAMIYSLISWVYQIILVLCNADILKNGFEIQNLVGRIYIIIGVVVLFLVAYSLLKSMVNPDEALKGKKSPVNILKDVIISVVLIAVIPTIFEFALGFQGALLTRNTIGSLILGSSVSVGNETEDTTNIINTGGTIIATGVLEAFLHPDYSQCTKVDLSDDYPNGYNCENVKVTMNGSETSFDVFWKTMQENNNLFAITSLSKQVVESGPLNYYWFISTIAGAFVLFVFISYCFDIAVRAVKLAVFELIAPLPILARILPNEQGNKIFSNWTKATISTYVEVFIRLAILFFAVLIIKIVIQNFPSMFILFQGSAGFTVALFAQMFLILGIILFVKQAPEIIKEITGLDGGKYNVLGSAMRGLSAVGALATGTVRGFNTTEWNDDHKLRSIRNKFANTLGGGLKSLYNTAGKEYKTPKDIVANTHSSVEDVISKQRKKQAAQLAKDREVEAYRQAHPSAAHEPDWIYKARTRAGNFGHNRVDEIKDWAGKGAFDSASLTRTKELADKVESNFSALENTWKKGQSYIDAKSDRDKAENLYNAMKYRIEELKKGGMSEAAATTQAETEYGSGYNDAKLAFDKAKGIQTEIERAEQIKKAEPIAAAARQIQLATAQYSDIKLDNEEIIKRTADPTKQAAMRAAIAKYNDLSKDSQFKQLISDLRSEDHDVQDEARALIDFYDNMKKEANKIKNDAVYAESVKGDSAKKKEDK